MRTKIEEAGKEKSRDQLNGYRVIFSDC